MGKVIGKAPKSKPLNCPQCGNKGTVKTEYRPLWNGQLVRVRTCTKCTLRVKTRVGQEPQRTAPEDGGRHNRKERRELNKPSELRKQERARRKELRDKVEDEAA